MTIGCEIGKYGKGCSNLCSGQCLQNVTCNPITGHCDSGCASGYVEPFCSKGMCVIIACLSKTKSRTSHLKYLYLRDFKTIGFLLS